MENPDFLWRGGKYFKMNDLENIEKTSALENKIAGSTRGNKSSAPLRLCAMKPLAWVAMLCLVGASSAGCVQRRLTIRTDPPGAMAYVDGYPIGTTPISTDFIYYGTREIRLVKDGYETVVVKQRIWPPWYEIPPLDFISENLVPGELRDHRILEFRLQPQRITPPEQLVDRAERLRRGEIVLPGTASGTTPPGPPVPGQPPSAGVPRLIPPGGTGPGTSGGGAPFGPTEPGNWRPASGSAGFGIPAPGSVPPEPEIGGRSVHPLPNGGI